jgi:RHS repeat-associated protein
MDGLGHVVTFELTSDPDCSTGDITATTYDGFGRVHTKSNPYCTTGDPTYGLTTYTYDALGRTSKVTNPDSTTVVTTYSGPATEVQDEGNGNGSWQTTRISQTDGLGRLAYMCEVAPGPFVVPAGDSTSSLIGQNGTPASCGLDIGGTGFLTAYQYNYLDDLVQVNQGTMAARAFAYDSLSRLTSATNSESGTLSYAYDANSNLYTKTAPAPNQAGAATVVTTYAYDALNRVLSKSYSDGTTPSATFAYDSSPNLTNTIGRLVASSGGPGIGTYTEYDPMGRISGQRQYTPLGGNNAYPLPYTYDYLGNMVTASDGYFHSYFFGYNTASRLTGLTSSLSNSQIPATLLSGGHYNAAGQITSDTLGTSEVETYTYTKRNWLQAETAKLSATQIYAYSLTFAPDGGVIGSTDSVNGNWSYSYDQFNRLVCSNLATNGTCASPTSGTPTYSYVYDRFGNRWQQNGPNTMLLTFTGNNPANPANNNRMDGYAYDAAGNLLNDGTSTYTYDAENRIIKVAEGGTTIATYQYDANGRRVHRTGDINACDNTGESDYVYDLAGHWTLDVNTNGTACKTEIWAGSRHFVTNGGDVFFDHSDWLGTMRLANTYRAPNQFGTCTSLPFGDALTCAGSNISISTIHFTGKERDHESGLDNFGARYNASNFGRFMTPDWDDDPSPVPWADLVDPQSLNLYAYGENDPVSGADNGHCDGGVGTNCDLYASSHGGAGSLYGVLAASVHASAVGTVTSPFSLESDYEGGIITNEDDDPSYRFIIQNFNNPLTASAGPLVLPRLIEWGIDGVVSLGGAVGAAITIGLGELTVLAPSTNSHDTYTWPAAAKSDVAEDRAGTGEKENTKGKRTSTKKRHQQGQARKRGDQGGRKADKRTGRVPRTRPPNHQGKWPPDGSFAY